MSDRQTSIISTALWFEKQQRLLPWRENNSAYRVWVSEIMLQQTTVATVIPYFERFMSRFPSLDNLAHATEQEVLQLWAGLGYYSRAQRLLQTAKDIGVEDNFPKDVKGLRALKGVGAYTAAAVASIAYDIPEALVDTNVERVLGRFFALRRTDFTRVGFIKEIQKRAQELMDEAVSLEISPRVWNQSVMEIGALLCGVKKLACEDCPLKAACKAPSLVYPGEKPKPLLRDVKESILIEVSGEGFILAQNIEGRRKGLWDFPQGKSKDEQGQIYYRISNDKVCRTIFYCEDKGRALKSNERRFLFGEELPPLVSPAKKIVQRYEKVINKE